jgi:hypothetical protein
MWGIYKRIDGWEPWIRSFRAGIDITGGYLVLVKRTRIGSFGYVAKGPLWKGDGPLPDWHLDFTGIAKRLNLSALIVQPPDDDSATDRGLAAQGWTASSILGIIDATLMVSLSDFAERPYGNIRTDRRKNIRKGQKSGLTVRECGRAELPIFFTLMGDACRRNGIRKPNPPDCNHLFRLWDSFDSDNRVRLTLVERGKEVISGQISIPFGDRVTFWKKGWSGGFRELHPNDLMQFDVLSWATSNGFSWCDFGGFGDKSPDRYNLSFGGVPKTLPSARLRFFSGPLNIAFRSMEPVLRRMIS